MSNIGNSNKNVKNECNMNELRIKNKIEKMKNIIY